MGRYIYSNKTPIVNLDKGLLEIHWLKVRDAAWRKEISCELDFYGNIYELDRLSTKAPKCKRCRQDRYILEDRICGPCHAELTNNVCRDIKLTESQKHWANMYNDI